MPIAILTPGAPRWIWPASLIFAAVVALLFWSYRRAGSGRRRVAGAGILKAFGVAALAACLVEPLWTGTRAKPGANLFLILADNSRGMTIRDAGASTSRGEHLKVALTADPSSWQVRLEQDFDVRRYLFDSRLRSVTGFHELVFDGRATSLGASLHTIAERFRGRPLAGILLFTDGNATDLPDGILHTDGLPPVYPVVCGTGGPTRDLSISSIRVSQTAFEDAPVTIRADARADGFTRESIVAQVLDESGTKLVEETQQTSEHSPALTFRLQLQPKTAGVSFYTVRVSARKDLAQFDDPGRSTEATLENNRRLVVVDRGGGPYHVLYVSGRPNWEFKFLRRALDEDPQVRLVGMIRVANREPKFAFRAGTGDAVNPLFRGFKDAQGDDTERYDQAVIVRINTLDESELRDGFPKTREQLYAYHAVVLDDVEAAFFTHEQMALLRRFVSERGGGFLMLGGQGSFRQGKYERTPVEELLPVYLDRPPKPLSGEGVRLALTREGWLQPWVRLRSNESDEKQRLSQMPEFRSLNRVGGIKPGASVMASVTADGGTEFPGLVAQRFGQGRVGALLIGDFWRWGLRQDPENRDLEKAWRQMIRWLVADVPGRAEVQLEPPGDSPSELVQIAARVRTDTYEPQDNAAVTLTVRSPDGDRVQLEAEPSLTEAGLYQATYCARQPGAYLAEAAVADDQGRQIGKVQTGWTADPVADEFRSIHPNRRLLEELAAHTGGEIVDPDRLESFAAGLPSRKAPVTEQWAYPIWHRASVFLLAVLCLVSEWGVRRWKGLP